MPWAPGLLSTITGWPNDSLSFAATTRAMAVVTPAAPNGTIIRTGRSGKPGATPVWANACPAVHPNRTAAIDATSRFIAGLRLDSTAALARIGRGTSSFSGARALPD